MEMTIDEAITILGMVEAHGVCIEAKDIAVETMRKYQKIEQIMKKRYGRYHIEIVQEIKEVMEDGNVD